MPAPSTFNGNRGTLNAKHPASATSCLDSIVSLNKTENNLEVIVSKEEYIGCEVSVSNTKEEFSFKNNRCFFGML